MAKLRCFSARDAKLGIFYPPFFMAHLGQALRNWEDLVNNPETVMGKHPSDFTLYEIGMFDEESGEFFPHPQRVHVAEATEAKRKPEGRLPLQGIN